MALRLTGPLDLPALSAALTDVIGRHEVLRTTFPASGGQPGQQVVPPDQLYWELPVSEVTQAGLGPALAAHAWQPFDLLTQIPVRARLLRLAPDDHVLAVVIHHIAGDGWSMGPLARDLSVAYTARAAGREPGWAPLPVQYADYALWQRELLGSEDDPGSIMTQQVAYWRQALAGAPAELALPATGRVRPSPATADTPPGWTSRPECTSDWPPWPGRRA